MSASILPGSAVPNPQRTRNIAIAGGVVLFHVAALWALQSGLVRRAIEVVVPVAILVEPAPEPKVVQAPPAPPAPPQPAPPPKPAPAPRKVAPPPRPAPAPAPRPIPAPEPAPAPAPIAVPAPAVPAPPVPAAPAPAPAPVAPAPPAVELPSSDAAYLQNPKPPYPPISRRLGEQGKVVVRVLIGADGNAQRAEVAQSSGYERLDQAAVATVLKWRYVPGKRGGVPEAMWFNVPINFVLE